MRRKGKYVLLLIVFIIGFSIVRASMPRPNYSKTPNAPIQSVGYQEELNIVKSATKLSHGERGYITLQGQPGKEYIIKTSYKKGNKIINVSQRHIADENGQVTFIWGVSKETVPGIYPITIMGEGKILNLDHTVLSKSNLIR